MTQHVNYCINLYADTNQKKDSALFKIFKKCHLRDKIQIKFQLPVNKLMIDKHHCQLFLQY